MTRYRVIKVTTDDFRKVNNEESTYWEGSDIRELSQKYPPSNVWGADHLGHHEIEDGWVRWHFRFEEQKSDGTWIKCQKDPRIRFSQGMTDLEREIDAENRRDFPGDYEDDDDYYDDEDEFYDEEYFDQDMDDKYSDVEEDYGD